MAAWLLPFFEGRVFRTRWSLLLRDGTLLEVGRWLAGPPFGADLRSGAMGSLLHYAVVFLVIALVAALVGFGGVAGIAMEGARLLFWIFIVLFIISAVAGVIRRGA